MPSIASSTSTSSEVHRPDFEIYTDFRNKSEDDDWDGNIYPDQTLHARKTDDEPAPPYIVLVQGPPNVGKSLLIKSLVKYFTLQHLDDIQAPITIIAGKKRRLQFIECPDDISGMIDAAKYADLVLLLVDASYGFEAETFEFLNLLRTHGIPPIMGVLTHLDKFKTKKERTETIKRLQDHFKTEICQLAKIYNLIGIAHELYKMRQLRRLAEKMLQFRLSWRAAHPYVLVDRLEDVTPEELRKDANCKRNISLYGYLRGCNIKRGAKVHLAGAGDFHLAGVRSLTDPYPLSSEMEKENDFVELTNMDNESFRTGTYLRLEVHDVPGQMVQKFDPCRPILVGGIDLEEENAGYIQARLKRHEWHMKLLKSGDPITVSAGWRRYQTKPIYALKLNKKRHEITNCIPQYEHCLAMFWGPPAPPNTRIAVVQGNKEAFRITATAVVLDPKHDLKILKESKLRGTPLKIGRRIADIKFPPDIEDAKFKGVSIWTCSGIQGKVRKAAKKGIARCTFKDRIDRSDTVFMPVFRQVEVPRFFEPLLVVLEKEDHAHRRGVEIIDGDLRSYSSLKYLTLPYLIKNVRGKTVVVMSEKKRAVETLKRNREVCEKQRLRRKNGPPTF